MTDPANSCQLQPVNELSVASADQEPALTQRQQLPVLQAVEAPAGGLKPGRKDAESALAWA